MLRPSYIFDNGDIGPSGQATAKPAEPEPIQEKINPKLRQFYEVKTKIEPFYTGGKLVILSPCHFICQCGPCVKVISTSTTEVAADKSSNNQTLEIDSEPIATEGDEEDKKINHDCFQVTKTYECDMDEIISFDACTKSQILITAHKSNLVRMWDLNDQTNPPQSTRTIKSFHTVPIGHLELDHNNIYSMTARNSVRLSNGSDKVELVPDDDDDKKLNDLRWATVAGAVVKVWETGGSQVSKALNVDSITALGLVKWATLKNQSRQRLFAAERNIYVIDFVPETKQYQVSHVCEGHFSQVTGIEWNDNNLMISGGRDNVIILWDMTNSYQRLKTIQLPGSVEALISISSSDLYLALSPSDIRYFNLDVHKLSTSSVVSIGSDEKVIAFHPSHFKTSDEDEHFWISTLSTSVYQVGKKLGDKISPNLQINKQFVGSLEEIFAVALWSDMKVAVANNTSIIRVYNLETGSCRFLRGHKDIVLTLSVQKNWLVSGSKDNSIMYWTEDSDVPQFVLSGHIASVTAVCFDPLRMIVYSAAEDTFIKAWTQTKCIQSAVAHAKEIHSVHCSPNGAMIVSSSRDKTAKIWDAESLDLLGTLKGHKKSVWDAKFSLWDQLVVTASADTTLKIWNIPTFQCIKTFQGHTSSVLQACFINSGLQVLSTSSDGTLKAWDFRSSTCISTFENSDDKVWALDAVPDGSLVVTGAADSILTVWIDVTEEKYKASLEKKSKIIEEDQRLTNLLRKGDWQHAIKLAIELDRPLTLLKIIRDVPKISELEYVIVSLEPEYQRQMMKYVKRWNTNSRTSTEAQTLLNILLNSTRPSELGHIDTVSLLPYTTRHFQRVQKNLQHIALVKYLADSTVD